MEEIKTAIHRGAEGGKESRDEQIQLNLSPQEKIEIHKKLTKYQLVFVLSSFTPEGKDACLVTQLKEETGAKSIQELMRVIEEITQPTSAISLEKKEKIAQITSALLTPPEVQEQQNIPEEAQVKELNVHKEKMKQYEIISSQKIEQYIDAIIQDESLVKEMLTPQVFSYIKEKDPSQLLSKKKNASDYTAQDARNDVSFLEICSSREAGALQKVSVGGVKSVYSKAQEKSLSSIREKQELYRALTKQLDDIMNKANIKEPRGWISDNKLLTKQDLQRLQDIAFSVYKEVGEKGFSKASKIEQHGVQILFEIKKMLGRISGKLGEDSKKIEKATLTQEKKVLTQKERDEIHTKIEQDVINEYVDRIRLAGNSDRYSLSEEKQIANIQSWIRSMRTRTEDENARINNVNTEDSLKKLKTFFTEDSREVREWIFDRIVEYCMMEWLSYRLLSKAQEKGQSIEVKKTNIINDTFNGIDYVVVKKGKENKHTVHFVDLALSENEKVIANKKEKAKKVGAVVVDVKQELAYRYLEAAFQQIATSGKITMEQIKQTVSKDNLRKMLPKNLSLVEFQSLKDTFFGARIPGFEHLE